MIITITHHVTGIHHLNDMLIITIITCYPAVVKIRGIAMTL